MGVIIHGTYAEVDSLVLELEKSDEVRASIGNGKLPARELLELIMPHFGVVNGGKFFTVYNEYFEDYDPFSNFSSLVRRYYDILDEDWYFPFKIWEDFGYGVTDDDVAHKLGLELSEDEDYGW